MPDIHFEPAASADDGFIFTNPSSFNNTEAYSWIGGTTAVRIHEAFTRYRNVTIPAGATIDYAYFDYLIYSGDTGNINLRIYGCDEDNSAAVTSYADYNAKTLTTAYTDWTITCPVDYDWLDSEEITDIVQEIIDRPGWASGNAIQILLRQRSDGVLGRNSNYDSTNDNTWLYITYHVDRSTTQNAAINVAIDWKIPTIVASSKPVATLINAGMMANIPIVSAKTNVSGVVATMTATCPTPAVIGNSRVLVSQVANTNVEILLGGIKRVVDVGQVANANLLCLSPSLLLSSSVSMPLINVGLQGYISDTVKDLNVIDIRFRAWPPTVEANYYPPVYVPPITIDNDYLYRSRVETFKYELLTLQNGAYKSAGFIDNYVESANVSIDFSRDIIGTANINIRNNTEINYLVDLIKPWYVINDTYEFPMGTFMLMSPKKQSNGILVNRPIQCYDLLLALDQDKTLVSVAYAAGSNVVDLVESLVSSVGTWAKYSIVDSTEALAEDINYELGRSKLFIINSLLNMINYYPLWCDGNGVYRGIPWNESANITHEFIDNEFSLYESGIEMDLDYTNMYNRVVIINNQLNEDTAPLYKVWTFEDENLANHPFSYTSIGRYVTKIFNSEAVSQSYVDLRARREILKMLEIEENINYNHVFVSKRIEDGLPWQGDGYRFKNTLLDVDSIYKIESLNIPLTAGGLVSSTIKRIRSTY